MLIVGENDFHIAPLFQEGRFGQKQYFLNIVKKTYAINDDEGFLEPIPKADQPGIAGPTMYEDDLGRSLMYPGDIDTQKPLVDVVINGCAFAPGGDPVTELGVSVDIAGRRKTLRVFGNRRWEKNEAGEVNISDTEPFTKMPIRWEKAFGYLNNRQNPLGMGKEQDHETDPENPVYSLPNVENPTELITQFGQEVRPVGFSAISESWEPRQSLFGTRSAYWANFRAPLPPKDQDVRYHNAAPEDQQFEELNGDEVIKFTNFHERLSDLSIKLPGIKPRLFYVPNMRKEEEEQSLELIETPLVLDTVVIDLNEKLLTLVWRGHLDASNTAVMEKFYYLYAVEDTFSPSITIDEIQSKFNEDVKDIDLSRQSLELDPETLKIGLMAPVVAEIVKTLTQVEADPAFIAQIAAETDPKSLQNRLEAEFNKVATKAKTDLEQQQAKMDKFNAESKPSTSGNI